MVERLTLKKLVWSLAFFYLPWVVVGWIFGHMPWLLLAATAIQLGWQLHNQVRLSTWLWDDKRLTPPAGTGMWESLFNGIYRIQQRQRKKRKELTNLIRRFRNGAESVP